ncbi:hypothetical protein M231_04739 [Tremella mesenterica]|uniref:Uncharacterized protein n=1 Tax=Tremella mesenterica TaxID=5217 RepID=A0A4Q1BJP7_TREME|nr:hypothetical protein M231_04739 [Tremella mesenterica]
MATATRDLASPSAGSEHSLHSVPPPASVPMPGHNQDPSTDSTVVEKVHGSTTPPNPGQGEKAAITSPGDGKDESEGWDVVSARDGSSPPKKAGDDQEHKVGASKPIGTGGKVAEAIKKLATKATTPSAKPPPHKLAPRPSMASKTSNTSNTPLNRSTGTKPPASTTSTTTTTTARPTHRSTPSTTSIKKAPTPPAGATATKPRPSVAPSTTKPPVPAVARRQSVANSTASNRAPLTASIAGKPPVTSRTSAPQTTTSATKPTMATAGRTAAVPSVRPTGAAPGTPGKGPAARTRTTVPPPASTASSRAHAATTTGKPLGHVSLAGKTSPALEVRIKDLESRIEKQKAEFDEKIGAWEAEKAELRSKHDTAVEALQLQHSSSTESALADAEKKLADLKAAHALELEQQREAAEATTTELKDDLDKAHLGLQAALEEHKTLASKSESHASEIDQLRASVTAAEEALQEAQKEAISIREIFKESEDRIAQADQELQDLRFQAAEQKQEIQDLVESLDKEQHSVVQARNELEGLHTQISELQAAQAQQEAHWKAERERLETELGASSSGLQAELEDLRAQLKEAKEKEGAAEAAWAAEKETLTAQSSSHMSLVTETKDQLQAIRATAEHQEFELQELRKSLAEMSTSHSTAREEADTHAAKIEELTAQMSHAATEHDKLLMETAQLSDAKVLELEHKLATAMTDKAEVLEKLHAAENRASAAEDDVRALEEARADSQSKIKALEQALTELEDQAKAAEAAHEKRYQFAFEEAKAAAQESHVSELAAIRAELAKTHEQVHAAHSAELEALAADHATAMASINADHAADLESFKEQHLTLTTTLSDTQAKLERATGLVSSLTEEVDRLERLTENLEADVAKRNPDAEEDLKKALKDLESVRDELEGTKTVLEMNKNHFQQTLEEMQSQHGKDLSSSAETRAEEADRVKREHEEEIVELLRELKAVKAELQDERVAKNTAVAQLAARTRTPPPISSPPMSPSSLTKLHEAHNAKVAELEGTIKRLVSELENRSINPTLPTVPAPTPAMEHVPSSHEPSSSDLITPSAQAVNKETTRQIPGEDIHHNVDYSNENQHHDHNAENVPLLNEEEETF